MNRHSRRGHAGFSMVELLVTIVIAGIAFAAMVPLFVQAQQKNSSDYFRVLGTNIVTDKLEKIRQVPYDQITEATLNSTTFFSGSFGPTVTISNGGSNSRTFAVTYRVTASADDQFKTVTVRATWTPPPRPAYTTEMSTKIYKQYAGPQIQMLTVEPLESIGAGTTLYIDEAHVDMTALVSDVDLQSLRDPYNAANVGRVQFSIFNAAGTVIAGGVVKPSTDASVPIAATYTWGFDRTVAISDGLYVFKATAYSYRGFQGNTAQVVAQWELGAPSTVTGLAAKPGNGQILVSWDTSLAGDLDHYELYRGTSPGTATLYQTTTDTSYLDTGLTNGQTYYYQVRAVDKLGETSALSAETSATPVASADSKPPTAPDSVTAAIAGPNNPTIVVTWGAATDPPPPSPQSGVASYVIERAKSSTGPWAQIESNWAAGNLSYPDANAGFSSTWYYRVRAIDAAGNVGPYSNVASAKTDPARVQNLTVRNTSTSKDYYCVVRQLSPPQAYFSTAGVPYSSWNGIVYLVPKKGGEVVWRTVPAGLYAVYFSSSSVGPWTTSKPGDLTPGDELVQVP